MKHKINISDWNRKSHFNFFKDYDNPFFNVCSTVEVTELLIYCKTHKISFFLASLFLTIKTANEIEEFKYRIEENEVNVYDLVHPFSTIINSENVFTFCDFQYIKPFSDFLVESQSRISRSLELNSLNPKDYRNDVIHYTSIPWIELTSVSHPKKYNSDDSVPKIAFGKYHKKDNKTMLPISIEVHHSLIDGYHVGKYLEKLRLNIIDCEKILSA